MTTYGTSPSMPASSTVTRCGWESRVSRRALRRNVWRAAGPVAGSCSRIATVRFVGTGWAAVRSAGVRSGAVRSGPVSSASQILPDGVSRRVGR